MPELQTAIRIWRTSCNARGMTNGAATAGIRPIGWLGMVIGSGMTIAFTLAADLAAMALNSRGLGAALSVIAFFMAGLVTVRMRPTVHPIEPGIGAGATVLVFSIIQISLLRGAHPSLPAMQVGLSVLLAVVIAFLAAWYGARISARLRARQASPKLPFGE